MPCFGIIFIIVIIEQIIYFFHGFLIKILIKIRHCYCCCCFLESEATNNDKTKQDCIYSSFLARMLIAFCPCKSLSISLLMTCSKTCTKTCKATQFLFPQDNCSLIFVNDVSVSCPIKWRMTRILTLFSEITLEN